MGDTTAALLTKRLPLEAAPWLGPGCWSQGKELFSVGWSMLVLWFFQAFAVTRMASRIATGWIMNYTDRNWLRIIAAMGPGLGGLRFTWWISGMTTLSFRLVSGATSAAVHCDPSGTASGSAATGQLERKAALGRDDWCRGWVQQGLPSLSVFCWAKRIWSPKMYCCRCMCFWFVCLVWACLSWARFKKIQFFEEFQTAISQEQPLGWFSWISSLNLMIKTGEYVPLLGDGHQTSSFYKIDIVSS